MLRRALSDPENHRDMGEFGHIETQCLIHQNLAGCIVDMVITADYMRDVHKCVIDDDGKVIGRIPIAALNDQVIQLIIIKADISFNEIFHNCHARLRAAKADNTAGRFL